MKRVLLTDRECELVAHAVRIASEDGSIYGGSERYAEINRELDKLLIKINQRAKAVNQ